MSEGVEPLELFEAEGETALAWYFVLGHWPREIAQPRLQVDGLIVQILLPRTRQAIADLLAVIEPARNHEGPMLRQSVAALLGQIESRGLLTLDD
jgi:hypothetical protein